VDGGGDKDGKKPEWRLEPKIGGNLHPISIPDFGGQKPL